MIEPIKKRVAATKESSSKDMVSFAEFADCDSRENDMMSTPPNNVSFFNVFKRRKYFTLFKARHNFACRLSSSQARNINCRVKLHSLGVLQTR